MFNRIDFFNKCKENKAGLYLTISFHLILLIIFLCISINSAIKKETTFIFDFSQEEELAKLQEQKALEESVNEELNALISSTPSSSNTQTEKVRNAVVNLEDLQDDRYKNPASIYDDAKKLQEKLNANKEDINQASDNENNITLDSKKKKKSNKKYIGPSVISYSLKGRKAMYLPIPAYKCEGEGTITVAISVNRNGYVKLAEVINNVSSPDDCLRNYAIRAAKRSRFQASSNATSQESGTIVYQFIAQ
ncbi:MAG: hypothetical protein WC140_07200 [Bacteroidales bacterium]